MDILLLSLGMFMSGFIDAIAGGGGLISTPVLLFIGLPPHVALGTNKLASVSGALTSSYEFFKEKKIHVPLLKMMIPFAFLGGVLGVLLLQLISSEALAVIIPIMILLISIYTIFSKTIGKVDQFQGITQKNTFLGRILSLFLGFYDGFFGPGTGTFFMFGLIKIFRFDFTLATANTKVLNLTTGVSALLTFLFHAQVNIKIGVFSIVFMMLGAKIGARMAIKKGSFLIKPVFILISLSLSFKLMYSAFFNN